MLLINVAVKNWKITGLYRSEAETAAAVTQEQSIFATDDAAASRLVVFLPRSLARDDGYDIRDYRFSSPVKRMKNDVSTKSRVSI